MTESDPIRPRDPSEEGVPPTWPPPTWPPPTWPPAATRTAPRRHRAFSVLAAVVALALLAGAAVGVRVTERSTSAPPFGLPDGGTPPDDTIPGSGFDQFGPSRSSAELDVDVRRIADAVSPAVVNIRVDLSTGNRTAGTGLVISPAGHVLTNNHVINGAEEISVELGVTGEPFNADVLGYDVGDDVALLKLDDASGMKTIKTAHSSSVARRDAVVAIGNALGRGGEPSAVPGTVTGLHRTIRAGEGLERESLPNMIRFAASIQPGDSGGALVNDAGQVVGMTTAADPASGRLGTGSGTVGYAIPIETALSIADQIRDRDASNGVHIGDRALLGVYLDGSDDGFIDGARVDDVDSGTPADSAGIEQGDTIISVAGRRIRSSVGLRTELDRYHPGDRVRIRWRDEDGDAHQATVTLVKGPPA